MDNGQCTLPWLALALVWLAIGPGLWLVATNQAHVGQSEYLDYAEDRNPAAHGCQLAKCGKVTCCGLWVQLSNPGCYSLFEQSSGIGSRGARLPPINGWQVRDNGLTAYTVFYSTQDRNLY